MRCLLFLLNSRGYGYEYGPPCGGCGSCAHCNGDGAYIDGMPWANNSGLFNSCAFVVDMLNASGVGARLVQISSPQEIADKIIACGATDVVVEALFVPPAVLAALTAKFPAVRFVVRVHSEILFLVNDSVAMEWIFGYLNSSNVSIAANTARCAEDLREVALSYFPHWDVNTVAHRVGVLPNYYPVPAALPHVPSQFGMLNVGCFGAIRPLKNQLLQAIASIEVARTLGKRLRFHVNASRIEANTPAILRNLRALFAHAVNAELVEEDWLPRSQFMSLVRRMDIGSQVSVSETFNIVSADFVTNNVPVIVSPEIVWCDPRVQAQPTQRGDIVRKMLIALRAESIITKNRAGLLAYNEQSRAMWLSVFGLSATGWTDRPASFVARPAITSQLTHG